MKTQYYTAASLDGFIATPDHSLEWLFALGELEATSYPAFIAEIGAIAMGASTYQWLLAHLDRDESTHAPAWPYAQPTWVFTHQNLPVPPGADIRFVQGDVRPVHAEMRRAAGVQNMWVVGGGDLAGQFYDAGLLDELIVQIGSVTLGSGMPLFPRRALSPALRLLDVQVYGEKMIELRYALRNPDVQADD